MGNMIKKRNMRVSHLEDELMQLESFKKPTLRQRHRITRIRTAELPKAQRNKARGV